MSDLKSDITYGIDSGIGSDISSDKTTSSVCSCADASCLQIIGVECFHGVVNDKSE